MKSGFAAYRSSVRVRDRGEIEPSLGVVAVAAGRRAPR